MNPGDAVEDFRRKLLRLDAGMEAILEAAKQFPEAPMVQLCAAAFYLYGQTAEADAAAAGCLQAADRASLDEHGRKLFLALDCWRRHEFLAAVEELERITERWPDDLLSVKFAEFLYYVLGQQHMGSRFRSHLERLSPVNGGDPDFLGMRAFARELCGDFSAAREDSEHSLELEPRNPWAHHALTHVLIREGLAEEGRRIMEDFLPQLRTFCRPIHCHDAWHLALLCLEETDYAAAEKVLRDDVWGLTPDFVTEQIDAIALGWRMEMAGRPADDLWEEIAPHIEARARECFMPFLNAHYAYALARAGRREALSAALEQVESRAAGADEEARRVWAVAGRQVVQASAAFGAGDEPSAVEWLEPVMPDMTRIGGSDAQNDLFRQMYYVSLARSGRSADARAYFERFNRGKRPTPLDEHFLSLAS